MASEMHVSQVSQIFSSPLSHFQPYSSTLIDMHPQSSTLIHIHPLLSTFIHLQHFCLFIQTSLSSNVWKVSSLKSHSLSDCHFRILTHSPTRDRTWYIAARASVWIHHMVIWIALHLHCRQIYWLGCVFCSLHCIGLHHPDICIVDRSIDWVVPQLTATLHHSSRLANSLRRWQTQILGPSVCVFVKHTNTQMHICHTVQTPQFRTYQKVTEEKMQTFVAPGAHISKDQHGYPG